MTGQSFEVAHSLAVLDILATSNVVERAAFWRRFAGRNFAQGSETAQALELAAGVELVSGNIDSTAELTSGDAALRKSSRALLGALELYLHQDTKRLGPVTGQIDLDRDREIAPIAAVYWAATRQFDAAARAFDKLTPTELDDPAMRLLACYVLFQVGRGDEAKRQARASIELLRDSPQKLFDADFWIAFTLVGDLDSEFVAFIATVLADIKAPDTIDIVIGLVSRVAALSTRTEAAMRDGMRALVGIATDPWHTQRISAHKMRRIADLLLQLAGAVGSSEETCSARQFASRLKFALGDEDAAHRLLGDNSPKLRVLKIARPSDLPGIANVRRFAAGRAFEIPETPMSRVDGRRLRHTQGQSVEWTAEIDGATLIYGSREGSIFWYVDTGEWLIADGLNVHPRFHFGTGQERFRAASPGARVLVNSIHNPTRTINGSSVLIGGVGNYYHWLLEYLPKLANLGLLANAEEAASLQYLINDDVTSWQLESLQACGVPGSKIVRVRGGEETFCARLIVPSTPHVETAVRFLRTSMGADRENGAGRKLYVSRLDAAPSRRRIEDEDGVALALANAGFEVLVPSEMSYNAQVQAFSEASVIVGPHGAGLTNIAFAPRNARVIEIVNSKNTRYRFFSDIAAVVGCRYEQFRSQREVDYGEAENAASVVDIEQLLRLLAKLPANGDLG